MHIDELLGTRVSSVNVGVTRSLEVTIEVQRSSHARVRCGRSSSGLVAYRDAWSSATARVRERCETERASSCPLDALPATVAAQQSDKSSLPPKLVHM